MKNLLGILLLSFIVISCKTTEANYRSAYEKAIAGRDSSESLDKTIYGRERRMVGFSYVPIGDGDTIAVRRQLVKVTEDGGGIRENLKRYCVVVGQFKQKFNAVSMRDRYATMPGSVMPGAFVVETGEPYFYVVASSYARLKDAADAMKTFQENPPFVMKSPLPFILEATASR